MHAPSHHQPSHARVIRVHRHRPSHIQNENPAVASQAFGQTAQLPGDVPVSFAGFAVGRRRHEVALAGVGSSAPAFQLTRKLRAKTGGWSPRVLRSRRQGAITASNSGVWLALELTRLHYDDCEWEVLVFSAIMSSNNQC